MMGSEGVDRLSDTPKNLANNLLLITSSTHTYEPSQPCKPTIPAKLYSVIVLNTFMLLLAPVTYHHVYFSTSHTTNTENNMAPIIAPTKTSGGILFKSSESTVYRPGENPTY